MGDGGGLVKSWCGELDEVEYRADVDSAMTDLHIKSHLIPVFDCCTRLSRQGARPVTA
jgi:hypothetical protein